MDATRYAHLQRSGEALTPAERAEGWHYCRDWDWLLIHPQNKEAECCTCNPPFTHQIGTNAP